MGATNTPHAAMEDPLDGDKINEARSTMASNTKRQPHLPIVTENGFKEPKVSTNPGHCFNIGRVAPIVSLWKGICCVTKQIKAYS